MRVLYFRQNSDFTWYEFQDDHISLIADKTILSIARGEAAEPWMPYNVQVNEPEHPLGTVASLNSREWTLVFNPSRLNGCDIDEAFPGVRFLPLNRGELVLGLTQGVRGCVREETTDYILPRRRLFASATIDFIPEELPVCQFFSLWRGARIRFPTGLFLALPDSVEPPAGATMMTDTASSGREVVEVWSEQAGPRSFGY